MIEFRRRTLGERVMRLWPPYRRRQDEALRKAIEKLMGQPWRPCLVDGVLIPNGYGARAVPPGRE